MPFVLGAASAFATSATAFLTGLGLSAAQASFALNLGASVLFSAATDAIFGGSSGLTATDQRQELRQMTSLPAVRYVYGDGDADGTPVPPSVAGDYLYIAYILNSRESALPDVELFLDDRPVPFTGDPFDMAIGATASTAPFDDHCTFWVGRGDQSQPPQAFLDDLPYNVTSQPDGFRATDRLEGLTVIWLKLKNGSNNKRAERWPNSPPVLRVRGKWSKVWDPRDPAQSLDDPSTWIFENNAALCTLDGVTQHPVRPYQLEDLHLGSWIDGADESDVIFQGARRFVLQGTLDFTKGEFADQIKPMFYSAAADPIVIGGQLGYSAAVWRAPETFVEYTLGDGYEVIDEKPASEMFNEFLVSYNSRDRDGELTPLLPWQVPGALAADNGVPASRSIELPFCPEHLQAQVVRKVLALKSRRQLTIKGGNLPPECFDLVAGSTAAVAFQAPYDFDNGNFEIQSIFPGFNPIGEDGGPVSLQLPAVLIEHGPEIYDFDFATEYEAPIVVDFDPTRDGVAPVGAISVTTGAAANLPYDTRARIEFAPSTATGVEEYEIKFGLDGEPLQSAPAVAGDVRDADGDVFGFVSGRPGSYTISVVVSAIGGKSDPTTISGVVITGAELDAPQNGAATQGPGSGEITVTFQTPNDPDVNGIEVFGADTDDNAAAVKLGETAFLAPNSNIEIVEGGLLPAQTRYYFARSVGANSAASQFTASVSATAT